MSDLQKKINQSLVWAEHQARVDCELRGGDVSEHWASIISSQYEELVGKVEALTEINRLQSEENKQLQQDKAELVEALRSQINETMALAKFHDNTLRSNISSTDLDPPEYYDWQTTAENGKVMEKHKCD